MIANNVKIFDYRGRGRGRGRGGRGGRGRDSQSVGRGRGRGSSRGRGGGRGPLTKEALDREIEEYMSTSKPRLDKDLDTMMAEESWD